MKKLILLSVLIIVAFISCKNETKQEKIEKKEIAYVPSEKFDWLVGEWVRKNEKKGKATYEIWKKNSPTEYSGFGYTIKDNDTVQQEFIKLINEEKKWSLKVEIKGDPDIVKFPMTGFSSFEFICENKNNDFPTLIKYWKNGDKLSAIIRGNNMQIPFEFERIK